ncbi:DUF3303 family protein [Streptomyces sp. TRM70350]|uniref:DUF3303 family protein n=1 Tax=Streptomyces sp. TRM70350 TaxID=2856165 RepID=UPI001C47DD85|nr:DUF3303 family protein [Streptomyces sp. TRM70350]MBV7696132.1 hypothetical protein [Streptomyces sp. TRM70350]
MRVMLKATLDTDKANEALRSGKLLEFLKEAVEPLKPEAAYFGPAGGRRTCFIVFDLQDSSELPRTLEPFFTQFNARTEVFPVMTGEDLQKGLAQPR